MKFKFGLPEHNEFVEEQNMDWKILRLFDSNSHFLKGVFLGVFLSIFLGECIDLLFFNSLLDFRFYKKIYLLLIIIPIHELLHIAFFPSYKNVILGFSLKKISFFVSSTSIFSAFRLRIISIMPFIILTIIPFITLFFFKNEYVAYICLLNLLASGVDLITFFISLKIPSSFILRFNGNSVYFKEK